MIASLTVQAGSLKNELRLAAGSTVQQSTIPLVNELMEWGPRICFPPLSALPSAHGRHPVSGVWLGAHLPDPFSQHGVLDIARGANARSLHE